MLFPVDGWRTVRHGLVEPSTYRGESWADEVLGPWLDANPAMLAGLRLAGRAETASVSLAGEDLWTLYAVSRLVEFLTAAFQPAASDPDEEPFDPLPAPSCYGRFADEVGGWWPAHAGFHPFLHEIVDVVPADDPDQPPVVLGQWWPGLLVGSMLLARAGVTVQAGAAWLDPVVARESALYWAWTRRHRPTVDLSHGWGSNSQWRTRFRRDYRVGDRLCYNVDAALRPAADRASPLPPADVAVGLVRHRCSTVVDHGPEMWVWDSYHTEPAPVAW